jgi:hypothetical protein
MSLQNIIKKKSHDCRKKLLFYEEFEQKKNKKYIYIFAYFSEQKSEKYYEWSRKAFSNTAYLISIPSAYTLIKNYCLQGPKIFIIAIESLTITVFVNFSQLIGIAVFINKKWYAFFVFYRVLNYQYILQICQKFLDYRFSIMLAVKETLTNLEKFSIDSL